MGGIARLQAMLPLLLPELTSEASQHHSVWIDVLSPRIRSFVCRSTKFVTYLTTSFARAHFVLFFFSSRVFESTLSWLCPVTAKRAVNIEFAREGWRANLPPQPPVLTAKCRRLRVFHRRKKPNALQETWRVYFSAHHLWEAILATHGWSSVNSETKNMFKNYLKENTLFVVTLSMVKRSAAFPTALRQSRRSSFRTISHCVECTPFPLEGLRQPICACLG